MWTNIFKITGLHILSWFQFMSPEPDVNSLHDKSSRVEQTEAAISAVISSHVQLQDEGFLSTWTNSFVGPWDPSQGLHNPDERIKLWLFMPGRHSTVVENAQGFVSRLKVIAHGLWLAPGDSEEVATALSQALRSRIEKSMERLSYVRFGDTFSKYRPFFQSEELIRKGQPTIEFVFSATEESIFIHVFVSAKHIRTLLSGDVERIVKNSVNHSDKVPVIVSPHGMCGRLTGCCPIDLVKHVYFRTESAANALTKLHSQNSAYQLKGQDCYAEVTLGSRPGNQLIFDLTSVKKFQKQQQVVGLPCIAKEASKGSQDNITHLERTFIYPTAAVVIPVMQMPSATSSLKRLEASVLQKRQCDHSSGNSNNSSISSISSTTSDSDCKNTVSGGDFEADSDSFTCKQSGMDSHNQAHNDGLNLGSKRPRTGIKEPFNQANTGANSGVENVYKSDFGSVEVNNSAVTGVVAGEHGRMNWDWVDDDRGIGMDIQILLSEFGDFKDFFENDSLPFGEPPGTAESQALMYSAQECEPGGSPCNGVMDISDQMFMNVNFPQFECYNPPLPVTSEDASGKGGDGKNSDSSLPPICSPAPTSGEFVHLIKSEALMTFAPEYRAVDSLAKELPPLFSKTPYLPKNQRPDVLISGPDRYAYAALPPSTSSLSGTSEKLASHTNSKTYPQSIEKTSISRLMKYYTFTEAWRHGTSKLSRSNMKEVEASCRFYGIGSTESVKHCLKKRTEGLCTATRFLLSMKNLLATEIECLVFQVSMCSLRHIFLSPVSPKPVGLNRVFGNDIFGQISAEKSTLTDNNTVNKYEVKKEVVPIRIVGDADIGVPDGNFHPPLGVWRTVGGPKSVKLSSSPSMDSTILNEDGLSPCGQRKPLQEFLDGLGFLVQQASSFIDVSLDAHNGDGIFGWLALQEQGRRGISCGPSMIHAGCGGVLASCHSLDIAGVELADPLAADVHAYKVISLLQSDIKSALKHAFGGSDGLLPEIKKCAFGSVDGPLSVVNWCKVRNHCTEMMTVGDGFSSDSNISDIRDPSSTLSLNLGEPLSPSQTFIGASSCIKDCIRGDDASQRRLNPEICDSDVEQQYSSQIRPTLLMIPSPPLLIGYQDDWVKTSVNALQIWEKVPLEPYALPKHMNYCVICPDIDPLISPAIDFFQQLGTVYEMCNLGAHSPQIFGNQIDIAHIKSTSAGFVLLDCPKAVKTESSNASIAGSFCDYFLSVSKDWDLVGFLRSLTNVLRALKFDSVLAPNFKDGNRGSYMVIYIICPFPDPEAVVRTVVQSSVALGSALFSSDGERRSLSRSMVMRSLATISAADEAQAANLIPLSGFPLPRLVLQIVTIDAIFRVTNPPLTELLLLKEIAFTVYNKARRVPSKPDSPLASSFTSGKPLPLMMQLPSSPGTGMWKDCVGSRKDPDLDPTQRSLQPWDGPSWQTLRSAEMGRVGEGDPHFMFEPLFIISDPDKEILNPEFESLKLSSGEGGAGESGLSARPDGGESDGRHRATASLHCCYGWTEDWRWVVCVWTDARGELLDSHVFPFGGVSSRQDTKGMNCLFARILHHGCRILQASSDSAAARPPDFIISRIGPFFELECQEWQKAVYAVGGSDMKKWPLHLRRSHPEGISVGGNGATSLQQQQQKEIGLVQERGRPLSPGSLYAPHPKASGFVKTALAQPISRKHLSPHTPVDAPRGFLHLVRSITFVSVSMDHSLQLLSPSESSGGSHGNGLPGQWNHAEALRPVKPGGSCAGTTYLLVPSPGLRFLPQTPLQMPTCLTSDSPPLAHLLNSRGPAAPFSTGFVVSKQVPSVRASHGNHTREEWPSVLAVGLVDHYGCFRGHGVKPGGRPGDVEAETLLVLHSVASELHRLSWMTAGPAYIERRTALPAHCDISLRLRRLLHFADTHLSSAA